MAPTPHTSTASIGARAGSAAEYVHVSSSKLKSGEQARGRERGGKEGKGGGGEGGDEKGGGGVRPIGGNEEGRRGGERGGEFSVAKLTAVGHTQLLAGLRDDREVSDGAGKMSAVESGNKGELERCVHTLYVCTV